MTLSIVLSLICSCLRELPLDIYRDSLNDELVSSHWLMIVLIATRRVLKKIIPRMLVIFSYIISRSHILTLTLLKLVRYATFFKIKLFLKLFHDGFTNDIRLWLYIWMRMGDIDLLPWKYNLIADLWHY